VSACTFAGGAVLAAALFPSKARLAAMRESVLAPEPGTEAMLIATEEVTIAHI
jgi:hypothetical protein